MTEEKNLQLERLVFFTDAVVAIAITLLSLELKIEETANGHLTFAQLFDNWHKFVAFFLSFISIAIFWKKHHEFFKFIQSVDDKLFWYNLGWLLFIALLPFTTSLISSYFSDTAAMFSYCLNTFVITFFQNQIWDYVAEKPDFLKKELNLKTNHDNKVVCNVAMLNGFLATITSLLNPTVVFNVSSVIV
jgi:uncharacterized membrane protein